jgi:hypothetical protein
MPGARHDGAAFASVKRVDIINIAPIADAARAIDNNGRIALTSKRRRAQKQACRRWNAPHDRADLVWRHQVFT